MVNDSPAVIIFDINGNPIGSILDGAVNRLQTEDKIASWFGSSAPTVGQKTMAQSIPVVLPIDQTVSITATIGIVSQGNPGTINNSWFTELTDGINILGTPTHPIRTDPTGTTTQPISGIITANQGNANTLSNKWPVQITDGINSMPTGDVIGRAIFEKITDGTTNATIKPASTAAIASDPALVIAISPNNNPSLAPPVDWTANGTISGLNQYVAINAIGTSHCAIQISGTWNATLTFEGTIDNSTWFTLNTHTISSNAIVASATAARHSESVNVNGHWYVPSSGLTQIRIIATVYSSGTATVYMRGVVNTSHPDVQSILPAESANLDAFGRQRFSQPETLFSSKQIFDNQTLFWDDQQTAGAGTSSVYQTNKSCTRISVTLNAAGTRVRQTFRRFNYEPGKSLYTSFTSVLIAEGGVGDSACNRRIGYFDEKNGVFFELDGTTINVGVRTYTSGTAVTTLVPQSDWNTDRMDGTGGEGNTSGIKLDFSKGQIFFIDFQWLGVGRIRFGFNVNGINRHCHVINNANANSYVFMSTPNLPLRFEIQSLGTGANTQASLDHICSAVQSEGGYEGIGYQLSADRGTTALITGNDTNIYALLALQIQSGKGGATVIPNAINVMSITNSASFRLLLLMNPTIGDGGLSYTPITNSVLQVANPVASNIITPGTGTQVYSSYELSNKSASSSSPITGQLEIGTNIAGVSDTLVLAVQPIPAAVTTFYGAISWREII